MLVEPHLRRADAKHTVLMHGCGHVSDVRQEAGGVRILAPCLTGLVATFGFGEGARGANTGPPGVLTALAPLSLRYNMMEGRKGSSPLWM